MQYGHWETQRTWGMPRAALHLCLLLSLTLLQWLLQPPPAHLAPLLAGIYPLQNTYIRKCKILKAPKFDLTKLMEVHGDYSEEVGAKIERPAEPAAETPAEEA